MVKSAPTVCSVLKTVVFNFTLGYESHLGFSAVQGGDLVVCIDVGGYMGVVVEVAGAVNRLFPPGCFPRQENAPAWRPQTGQAGDEWGSG